LFGTHLATGFVLHVAGAICVRHCSQELAMRNGEEVTFKSSSKVWREQHMPPDSVGIVLCRYNLLRKGSGISDRVDVQIAGRTLWGIAACELESRGIAPKS
jgi:hypothetical protein